MEKLGEERSCPALRTQLKLTALFQLLKTVTALLSRSTFDIKLNFLSWENYFHHSQSSTEIEFVGYAVELGMAALLLISLWRENASLMKFWLGMASLLTILTMATFFMVSKHVSYSWLSITNFILGVLFHFYQMMVAWDYSFVVLYESDPLEDQFVDRVIQIWRKSSKKMPQNKCKLTLK